MIRKFPSEKDAIGAIRLQYTHFVSSSATCTSVISENTPTPFATNCCKRSLLLESMPTVSGKHLKKCTAKEVGL